MWIACKDKMPEEKKCVLTYFADYVPTMENYFRIGIGCHHEKWIVEGWEEHSQPQVTHWMPLPPPPSQEK